MVLHEEGRIDDVQRLVPRAQHVTHPKAKDAVPHRKASTSAHARRDPTTACGDDDNYIQLAHLEADLRLVSQLVPATGMTLWGLLTWRSYYNNLSMDTSGVGFMGWDPVDWQAARLRLLIDRCAADLEHNSMNISSRVFKLQMLGATRNASLVRRWSTACARLVVPLRERALLSDMSLG
jgi:hypothetical protein